MENTFPTPLEIIMDPVALIILGMFAGLALWEAIVPAKQLPEIKGWKIRGLICFATYFYLSSYLPMITDSYSCSTLRHSVLSVAPLPVCLCFSSVPGCGIVPCMPLIFCGICSIKCTTVPNAWIFMAQTISA